MCHIPGQNTSVPKGTEVFALLNIQFGGHVDLVGDVLAVLLPLPDTLGQQVLDLSVHAAEVVLSPGRDGVIELG